MPSTGKRGQGLQADEARRRLLARRSDTTRCCSASTARPGPTRTSSRPICISSRKRRSATIADSAARWTCSTCRRKRRAWCSGIRKGWRRLAHDRGLYAPPAGGRGLSRGAHAAGARSQALGTSGHWEKFRENMFIAETEEERRLALKPMNCPGHVQIFKQGMKSYRDLPLRIAEFGTVHRYEPSGALHGLSCACAHFTQDDAHIFCTEDQITEECVKLNEQMLSIYRDFGFDRRAHQILRPAGQARRLRRGLGQGRSRVEARGARRQASITSSIRARAPSTGRSSNMCCATPSAATGNAARSRSISTCRCGSAPSISGPTERRPCR